MIFFGTRASHIKDGKINNVTCPNCNNITSMTYSIFGKYFHLYWVPAFPIGKETTIECDSCYRTYASANVSEDIKSKFEFEKQGTFVPIWHFSGVAIIVCLISFSFYTSTLDDKEDAKFIQEPIEGDMYSIKGEARGYYSAMRVTAVTADSVSVIYNDYETNSSSDIDDIDIEKNYTFQYYAFSRQELIQLFEEDHIIEIDRRN